jgi:hypothetical protein
VATMAYVYCFGSYLSFVCQGTTMPDAEYGIGHECQLSRVQRARAALAANDCNPPFRAILGTKI